MKDDVGAFRLLNRRYINTEDDRFLRLEQTSPIDLQESESVYQKAS